jgi:chloride channel 7
VEGQDPSRDLGTLRGIVLRTQLIMALKNHCYAPEGDPQPHLDYTQMRADYPRWPTVQSLRLPAEDMDKWMDLAPFLDNSPYIVMESCSLARIFHLFRTIGMRHLVVVSRHHETLGIITRKDLANINDHLTPENFRLTRALARVRYILPDNCDGYLEEDVDDE